MSLIEKLKDTSTLLPVVSLVDYLRDGIDRDTTERRSTTNQVITFLAHAIYATAVIAWLGIDGCGKHGVPYAKRVIETRAVLPAEQARIIKDRQQKEAKAQLEELARNQRHSRYLRSVKLECAEKERESLNYEQARELLGEKRANKWLEEYQRERVPSRRYIESLREGK